MKKNWKAFTRTLIATAVIVFSLLFMALFVLDPINYIDFSPKLKREFVYPIDASNQLVDRYILRKYSMEPQFDSAIYSSSVGYIFKTTDFDKGFNSKFLNMSTRAALPYEQTIMLKRFLRYHPHPKSLIFLLTNPWCEEGMGTYALRDPLGPLQNEDFPLWLVDNNPYNELLHLFSMKNLKLAKVEFKHLTGIKPILPSSYELYGSSQMPDSFHVGPVEENIPRIYGPEGKREKPKDVIDKDSYYKISHNQTFTRLDMLKNILKELPDTLKILVYMPRPSFYIPYKGTRADAEFQACKSYMADNFLTLPNTHIVDFGIEGKLTNDDYNFIDTIHPTYPLAKILPGYVVDAVKTGKSKPGYYNYLKLNKK